MSSAVWRTPVGKTLKAAERATHDDPSALAGVARALPALLRADKLQRRAARVGFDWPDPAGARDKIFEEIAETDRAASPAERHEEIGDLLFACVNWARHLDVDPEAALRDASAKFERRFRAMETQAGDAFPSLTLEEKEALWQRVKGFQRD